MAIAIQCEHCGKQMRVKDSLSGTRGLCPFCQGELQIPQVKVDEAPAFSSTELHASGVNGQLTLLAGRIRISRKGMLAFFSQGLKGDKEIQLSSISSIQWRSADLIVSGYIQFSFYGSAEAKGGIFEATGDENSIMFRKAQQPHFEAIRDAVQMYLDQRDGSPRSSSQSSVSVADEIRKLASLRNEGILTNEEFDAKKKQLLGL